MKVLALFSLLVAAASSYPVVKTWTLLELSDAIENSEGGPGMQPYLEDALDQIMDALFTGKNEKLVNVVVPSPSGGAKWTVEELRKAIEDPKTKLEYMPALTSSYSYVQNENKTGNILDSVEVVNPSLDISIWSLSDLNEALESPSTKPALIPFLEKANIELQEALANGETREVIYIVSPVGIIPHKADYHYLFKPSKWFIEKMKEV